MLHCALTGQIPKVPVVTPNGIIYDKEEILKSIKNSPVCPVTGNPLHENDLIELQISQTNIEPPEFQASSFGDCLSGLQNQWNILQKELFETRKKLGQCERELAQALYEKEAAKRIIARLITENPDQIAIHQVDTNPTNQ
ncbi:hypothetical protein TVAG_412620 [Trichomonas vaginalis G3]|uniref:Pre-mRNA-processing factor 19 n=1 Tax=Trichomonas vaginalis (strain ATCC PRA-98 / G3) TaxID=412133 RepID=A2EV75_TRIV3|nr:pre-mRNA-processing factor 19 family [Trichomonas vaginalis G3]EAY03458.1 hypothetical protein TVAG_412620 [Trichomonas vaginalis G3]KAI5486192.1 pre-mRNA-processing factor 19 family [Trichomonas vaginalis G3]|eukprot:XP_001315681.1 hypothetical protein [Trichomonas vaginalis G3]